MVRNIYLESVLFNLTDSERPKRPKSVSAETEISAKLTENSAEISAEILPKITWKWRGFFQFFFLFNLDLVIKWTETILLSLLFVFVKKEIILLKIFEKFVQNWRKIGKKLAKISSKWRFLPFRYFGRLTERFGRTISANFDRSYGRNFGFGRTLQTTDSKSIFGDSTWLSRFQVDFWLFLAIFWPILLTF